MSHQVCALASGKGSERHSFTEGDLEGARDGGGGEGGQARCQEGRGEGVDLSGALQ